MKSKVIYIAFSDIQIEDWKRFSEPDHARLEHNGIILSKVRDLCIKHNCPALFSGDFFDDPKSIKNYTLQRTIEWLNSFKKYKIKIYAIDGNHDQSDRNSLSHRSPNYLRTLSDIYPNIIHLDNMTLMDRDTYISGVPYMTDNKDLLEAIEARVIKKRTNNHILLIHTDLPGAKEPSGIEIEHQNMPRDIYKLLNNFDLVLNGHIHKPQKVFNSVYTLGATHHQRTSDSGCTMGLWLVRADLTMEFIPLGLPEFKYIKEGKEIPKDSNFYIPIAKEEIIKVDEAKTFLPTHSPNKLVKRYMDAKGIKSKDKEDLLLKYLTDAGE